MFNGVIEGFYGNAWSASDRLGYPEFLAAIGCHTYVYAPKSDRYLRADWRMAWSSAHSAHLHKVAAACVRSGVDFGIGLSPLGIGDCFDTTAQQQLLSKLRAIAATGATILCLLFDDIPGDSDSLAAQQLALCEFVETHWQGQLIMCPTYYSCDPALAQHFGKRPANYWPTLAAGLSSRWHVFWTGAVVVSATYSHTDLAQAAANFGRQPVIWDNYPVNDGRLLWPFLNLAARDRSQLQGHSSGVLHNPMNQAWCSKFCLVQMKQPAADIAGLLNAPAGLIAAVQTDAEAFQHVGLEQFSAVQKQQYRQRYAAYRHPLAAEIVAWLDGAYAFDPACLT